jgi:hypothetical protein
MAITYSYQITQLEMAPSLDSLPDVVTRIRFKYDGIDSESGYSGSFIGACPVPSPSSGSFTPLNELTETQVIEWVKVAHPTEHMKSQIQKQIQYQINPNYQNVPLPWAD